METSKMDDDENNLLLLKSSNSSLKRTAENYLNQETSSEQLTFKKVKVETNLSSSFVTSKENSETISNNEILIDGGCSKQMLNSFPDVKSLTESTTKADESLDGLENHDELYKIMRSKDCNLFKNFIENYDLGPKKLMQSIEKAYEKLKLNNVLLNTIEMGVEDLINLRFEYNESYFDTNQDFSKTTDDDVVDEIEKRIKMIVEIKEHFKEYFDKNNDKEVDLKFLELCSTIARHLHILKKQLRITYDKLPWEQMEFYLVCFVSCYTKFAEINWVYNAVLNKQNLYNYLQKFIEILKDLNINKIFIELKKKKKESEQVEKKKSRGKKKVKNQIIEHKENKIIEEFIPLYDDFKEIKNFYSLNKIKYYVELALTKTIDKKLDYLAIERALQVTGEYLKDSLESPNLSSDISEIIFSTFRWDTKRIIKMLRENLSHMYNQFKNKNKECLIFKKENARNYQIYFKNDLIKLKNTIETFLYEMRIEMVRKVLKKISKIETIEEAEVFCKLFHKSDILCNLSFPLVKTTEFEMIKSLIEDYKTEIDDLTDFEKKQFDKIHELQQTEIKKNENCNEYYKKNILLLIKLFFSILSHDNIEKIQDMAQTFLSYLEDNKVHNNKFYQLTLNIINRIQSSVETRLDDENLNELFYKISIHIAFKVGEIDSLRKFKDEFERKMEVDEVEDKINEFLTTLYKKLGDTYCIPVQDIFESYKELQLISKSVPLYDVNKFQDYLKKLNIKENTETQENFVNYFQNSQWPKLVKGLAPVIKPYHEFIACINQFFKERKVENVKESIEKLCSNVDPSVQQNLTRVLNEISVEEEKKLEEYFKKTVDLLEYAFKDETGLKYKENSEKLDSIFEILLLDIFAYFEEQLKCLSSKEHAGSQFFVDKSIPTPLGKSLRNYLAHGNPLLDILPCMPKVSIMLHICQIIKKSKNLIENKVPFLIDQPPLKIEYLKKCFDLNLKSLNLQQKMFDAIKQDNVNIIRDFIKQGADIYGRDINNSNVLHYACEYNSINIFKFLLNTNLLDDFNNFGEKPLHLAAKYGYEKILTHCLENKSKIIDVKNYWMEQELSLLYCAAVYKQKTIFKILFKFWNNGKNIYQFIEQRKNNEDGVDISFMISDKKCIKSCLCKKYIDENVYTLLHAAIIMKDLELLKHIIENGASVNTKNKRGSTPLHVAVMHNYVDCIKLLLEYEEDIDVEITNEKGLTALQLARHKETVNCLLNSGKMKFNCKTKDGDTLLHLAAERGDQSILEIYLSDKVKLDINCKTNLGITSLMRAVEMGHTHVVKYLIDHPKFENNIDIVDDEGSTVLHFAARNGNKNTLDILFETDFKKKIYCQDKYGLTPLHYAAFDGNESVVESIIEHSSTGIEIVGKEKNHTALHVACENGHDRVVSIMITKAPDINVNCIDKYGATPLHYAVFFSHKKVAEALLNQSFTKLEIHVKDKEKLTAAHYACQMGDAEILKLLLNKIISDLESEILTECDFKETYCDLLHSAVKKGDKNIVELILLKLKPKGIDVDYPTEVGHNALHLAAMYGQDAIVDVLLRNKVDKNCVAKLCSKYTPLLYAAQEGHYNIVKKLLEYKDIEVNCTDSQLYTPLHVAIVYKHINIVELLLNDPRVNKNCKTEEGLTPLFLGMESNNMTLIKLILNFIDVDINCTNDEGCTPLHWAIKNELKEIVEILLKRKDCDVNCKNNDGLTPLEVATNCEYKEIVDLLIMKIEGNLT